MKIREAEIIYVLLLLVGLRYVYITSLILPHDLRLFEFVGQNYDETLHNFEPSSRGLSWF